MSGSDSSGIKNQFEPGHFVRNITSGIVEAYAQCQRKAFFLLQGKIEGREHEYFQILKERATANRLRFEASPEVGLKDIVDKKMTRHMSLKVATWSLIVMPCSSQSRAT